MLRGPITPRRYIVLVAPSFSSPMSRTSPTSARIVPSALQTSRQRLPELCSMSAPSSSASSGSQNARKTPCAEIFADQFGGSGTGSQATVTAATPSVRTIPRNTEIGRRETLSTLVRIVGPLESRHLFHRVRASGSATYQPCNQKDVCAHRPLPSVIPLVPQQRRILGETI